MVFFKLTYFQKLTCIGRFGLFTKLKRGMGLVFTADFFHNFSTKNFFINAIKLPSLNIWREWPTGLRNYN